MVSVEPSALMVLLVAVLLKFKLLMVVLASSVVATTPVLVSAVKITSETAPGVLPASVVPALSVDQLVVGAAEEQVIPNVAHAALEVGDAGRGRAADDQLQCVGAIDQGVGIDTDERHGDAGRQAAERKCAGPGLSAEADRL